MWTLVSIFIGIRTAGGHSSAAVMNVYYHATHSALEGANTYESGHYHYPPHFTAIYIPFYKLGRPAGDVAWQIVGVAFVAAAFWLMARRYSTNRHGRLFLWTSLLALPSCMTSMRTGQANAMFAAMLIFSSIAIANARFFTASVIFAGATISKYLSMPMMLLSCLSHPKMILRLICVAAAWLALPFLLLGNDRATDQYQKFIEHVGGLVKGENETAQITAHRFADLNGIFRSLGYEMPRMWFVLIAAFAAFATAIYWFTRSKRIQEPQRALLLLALSVCYLMLFNPMTESNSYIISVPVIALIAINKDLFQYAPRLKSLLIVSILVMSFAPELVRPIMSDARLWLKPTAAILWLGAVITLCEREAAKTQTQSVSDHPA